MGTRLAKYMYNTYKRLREWRLYIKAISKAARSVVGDNVEIYVFGGAAENRLTALSDIDVAVVLPYEPSPKERLKLKQDILIKAIDEYGLPWDYPIELHVVGPERFKEIKRYSKVIQVWPGGGD